MQFENKLCPLASVMFHLEGYKYINTIEDFCSEDSNSFLFRVPCMQMEVQNNNIYTEKEISTFSPNLRVIMIALFLT